MHIHPDILHLGFDNFMPMRRTAIDLIRTSRTRIHIWHAYTHVTFKMWFCMNFMGRLALRCLFLAFKIHLITCSQIYWCTVVQLSMTHRTPLHFKIEILKFPKISQWMKTKMNPRNQKRVLHWFNFPDLKCVFENHVISFDIDEDDGLDEAVAKPLDLIW